MTRPVAVAAIVALAACGRFGFDAPPPGDASLADVVDAGSPIRFVQASPVGNAAGVGTESVELAAPPIPGDLIVLVAWTFAAASSPAPDGFSDGEGNVYQQAIVLKTGMCEAQDGVLAMYYAIVTGSAQGSVQVSYAPDGDGSQEIDMIAIEYTGLGSATLDRTASLLTPAGTSPQMFASGTTPTLSVDDELVVGAAFSCAGSPDAVMWADDAGFTTRGQTTNTLSGGPGIVGDKVVDQGGTYSDAWTVTYQTDNEVELGVIATFF